MIPPATAHRPIHDPGMVLWMDGVPDTGPLDFRLWLPRWDTHDGRLRCRMQASTSGLTQLNKGH